MARGLRDIIPLDEISKNMLGRYVDAADKSVRKLTKKTVVDDKGHFGSEKSTPERPGSVGLPLYSKTEKKIDSRLDSMDKAVSKMKKKDKK